MTVHYLGAEVKPVQWRDGQAPELFLGHVAAQDTVRHGHRLLNLREPACVVGEWHRRDIRRRGHRVRPRVRVISLGRAVVRVRDPIISAGGSCEPKVMDRFRALGTAAGVSSAGTFCRGRRVCRATQRRGLHD